ncbi:MAG: hypothetical protein GX383_09695 [Clostridium sp.]|nr:hypothetical protein [Clostridium sp.]
MKQVVTPLYPFTGSKTNFDKGMIWVKRFSAVFLIFSMLFFTSSCVMQSTAQKYMDSYNNTMKAETLQMRTEGRISIDLSGASESQKEILEGFKNVTFNIDEAMDHKNGRGESNYYINIGGNIINTRIFAQEDKIFMSFPGVDSETRYIKFDLNGENFEESLNKELMGEYGKIKDELNRIWTEAVKNEIIANEGNSFENTPEGDIKVNQLSFELTDEKVKNILGEFLRLVSQNEAVKKFSIETGQRFSNEEILKEDIEEGIEGLFDKLDGYDKEIKESFTLKKLKLTAKIDKDRYIIDERLKGEIIIKDGTEGKAVVSFEINTTRWNINRDIDINIPQIDEDEIIGEDEIDELLDEFYGKMRGDE